MKPDHELLRFKKGNLFSILAFDHRGSFIESMQKLPQIIYLIQIKR
jgi:hypothetical protein